MQNEHLEKVQKGFINLFKQAEKGFKATTTGIVDISKLAGNEVAKMMDLQGQDSKRAALPVERVLSKQDSDSVNSWSDSTGENVIPTETRGAPSPSMRVDPAVTLSHVEPQRPVRRYGDVQSETRREPKPTTPNLGPRSASDIRSAYGRDRRETSASASAGDVAAIMGDNVARLKERQEKLERLEERGADLEKSAANFADMARQLNQQANKPWWKLG